MLLLGWITPKLPEHSAALAHFYRSFGLICVGNCYMRMIWWW